MTFVIDPTRAFDAEVSRIVSGECRRAVAKLSEAGGNRHKALHEVRKSLKRIRALLRLVRAGDGDFSKSENGRYRTIAAGLSRARDAGALVETVDRLANGRSAALAAVRNGLVKRRDRIVGNGDGSAQMVSAALRGLQGGIEAAASIDLAQSRKEAARILADGLERNLRRARESIRQAKKIGSPEDFHELRKAVRDHTMHLELAALFWPGRPNKRLSAAKKLGDRLGELNDIAVMRHVLDGEGEGIAPPDEIEALQRRMRKKEKSLRRACLANAKRLFDLSPGKIADKAARNYRQAKPRRAGAPSNGQKPPLPRSEPAADRRA